jgi:hypothetical protein
LFLVWSKTNSWASIRQPRAYFISIIQGGYFSNEGTTVGSYVNNGTIIENTGPTTGFGIDFKNKRYILGEMNKTSLM